GRLHSHVHRTRRTPPRPTGPQRRDAGRGERRPDHPAGGDRDVRGPVRPAGASPCLHRRRPVPACHPPSRPSSPATVTTRPVGRTKLVQANRQAAFYRPLVELVTVVLGPAKVLAEELAGIDGILSAEIFGSWAARYRGEPGQASSDVDLLVVGTPDRD